MLSGGKNRTVWLAIVVGLRSLKVERKDFASGFFSTVATRKVTGFSLVIVKEYFLIYISNYYIKNIVETMKKETSIAQSDELLNTFIHVLVTLSPLPVYL